MWKKFKNWIVKKLWPWFKENWVSIVNFFVLVIVYGKLPINSNLGVFVGLWLFIILAVLGWKLFKKLT